MTHRRQYSGTTHGAVLTLDDISEIQDLVSQVKGQMTKVIQKLQKPIKLTYLNSVITYINISQNCGRNINKTGKKSFPKSKLL